jgi:RNA polymerase sigma-70 factor (ECF subfamily)
MQRASLVERLARVAGGGTLEVRSDFRHADDGHVEAVAGELLHLFRQRDDPEAFTLLFELCEERLMLLARRVTRQVGLAIDPEDLVAVFMARLFTDLRKDQPVVQRFFAFAWTSMRHEALNQLRRLKRAYDREEAFEAWLRDQRPAPDPLGDASRQEQAGIVQRLGMRFLSVVSRCFHRLPERDRRVLLAREVDGLSYADMAAALELPGEQVGMILKRARERLQRGIGAALAGLAEMEDGDGLEDAVEAETACGHDHAPGEGCGEVSEDDEREVGA